MYLLGDTLALTELQDERSLNQISEGDSMKVWLQACSCDHMNHVFKLIEANAEKNIEEATSPTPMNTISLNKT